MNVFIFTDLEGIRDVTDIGYMERGSEKYALACRFLSESIDLAIKTCFDCGAEHVYYRDGHGGGGNVLDYLIDERAVKCDMEEWQQLLMEGKIDCQIELGAHARAGTVLGFLDHTINSRKFFSYKVNGREMNELSMHALICAAYDVPTVACIGDETACEQAKEYIPDIYTGAVKKALCRNQAIAYENADNVLSGTIKNALANYKKISLYKVTEPVTIELTYYRTDFCEEAYAQCGPDVERIGARTLRRQVDKITQNSELRF